MYISHNYIKIIYIFVARLRVKPQIYKFKIFRIMLTYIVYFGLITGIIFLGRTIHNFLKIGIVKSLIISVVLLMFIKDYTLITVLIMFFGYISSVFYFKKLVT